MNEIPEPLELDQSTTEDGFVKLTQGWKNVDELPSVLIHKLQIPSVIRFLKNHLENG